MKITNNPDQDSRDDTKTAKEIYKKTFNNYIGNPSERNKQSIQVLSTNELLMVQNMKDVWESFLKITDINFKRRICAKVYSLHSKDIGEYIGMSAQAANDLLRNVLEPKNHLSIYKLAIMLNVPWQVILKERPIEDTLNTYWEYLIDGAAKWIKIEDINQERQGVKSICGYVIKNPSCLFEGESKEIAGRWVRSYSDFEYFEFHLSQPPVIDDSLLRSMLKLFPSAKAVITTYTPLRKHSRRSLWVVHDRKPNGHKQFLSVLKHRYKTIPHWTAT